MAYEIQLRRDTAANWTSANPTLASGEGGYETDTGKLKIGDGTTAWTSLAYFASGGVTSLDSITGAVVLHAGSNITITDNSPSAGDITIASSGSTSPLTTKGDIYGYDTADARIPVGTDGYVLTAASSQALGVEWAAATGSGGLVNLFSTTVTGSPGSLDTGASGIASGHGTLIISILAQSATASSSEGYSATVNGDTGANYDDTYIYGGGTAASNYAASAWSAAGIVHGTGGSQGSYASPILFIFPAYDTTTFYKMGYLWMATLDDTGSRYARMVIGWRSTVAINQFTIDCASHFSVGSTMTVYGTE